MTASTTRHVGDSSALENAESLTQAHYDKSWVVAIGIDYAGTDHPPLANAKNDASAFAKLLCDSYGFQDSIQLFDAQASKDAILELLESLAKKVGPQDRLVVFFAGHGTTRISESGFQEGYILPWDGKAGKYYSYIEMEDVRKACDWIPAKHILVILDCCFSGVAAVASRAVYKQSPEVINDAYLTQITKRKARQIMTAGASDEVVADSGSRAGHSAFTGALLTGLEGAADHNDDGVITASDLAVFIKPIVVRETASATSEGQTPFFNYLRGSDQGDLVFLRPDTPIIIHRVTPGSIPTPNVRSGLWLAVIGIIAVAMLGLSWLAFKPGPEPPDPTAMYQAVIATITADAVPQATAQAATASAAANKPEPTQTAIAGIQTKEAESRETVVAATIAALVAAASTPTSAPTQPDEWMPTPTPTSTPSSTPDVAATQAVNQAAADAQATATRSARQTAMAQATATAERHSVLTGPISLAGATTLEGLTNAVLEAYRSSGYSGATQTAYPGTGAGFSDYVCSANRLWDIALATGENREVEFTAQCDAVGRTPLGFQVGWGKVDVGSANERYEPLYLFTSKEVLTAKPQIAAFIRFYLTHVNDAIPRFSGFYTSASASTLQAGLDRLEAAVRQ